MTRHLILAATAALALALALTASGAAFAQSSIPQEDAALKRRAGRDAKDKALLDAERARPRIGGYWKIDHKIAALTTADGKAPPLNAAGKTLQRQRLASIKAGKTTDPMNVCLPPGTPRSLVVDEPFYLAQTPIKITFFHQVYHVIRHVFLDGPLKLTDDRDVLWEGHSSGRWEGDTLVIESGDFNGKQWLDDSGLPQSPDMRVTEKIRRTGADTLEDMVTYDDAKYYSAPWTARLTFKAQPKDTILVEEDCAEKLLEYPLKPYAPE
ncbi:MAG TPA: hypothetical protein VGM25_06810 [Caulobacteraceae bacterium]|jgi:hypothetical protein